MPITRTSSVSFFLIQLNFDVEAAAMVATLRRVIDGQQDGTITFQLTSEEIGQFLLTPADGTKTRRDDITLKVYEIAVARGLVSGEVS